MKILHVFRKANDLSLGVILSYALMVLNIVSGILLVPFIVKNIGQSNYGIYTAAASLITLFIMDLGLGTAVTKFISKYRVTSTQEEINKLTTVVFIVFLALSSVLAVIFAVIFPFLDKIYTSFSSQEISHLRIVFIIVASYSVITFPFNILNGVLVAYDKIFLTKISDIISKLIFIVLTVCTLFLNLGLYFLTACYAIHGIVSVIFKFVFVKTKTPFVFFTKINSLEFMSILKKIVPFSLWSAINSFGRLVLISIGPTILGFTSAENDGTIQIAIFSIATQVESYVSLCATSFGSIFYPSISRILFQNNADYTNNLDEFSKFHISIAKVQAVILALITLGLIVCGKEFIFLWVGERYEQSYFCIILLCVSSLFFYPLQTAENAMAAIDEIKLCSISTLASVAFGIASSFIFSYFWGAIGLSFGILLGFGARIVFFNFCFNKKLRINSYRYHVEVYGKLVLIIIPILMFGLGLNRIIPPFSIQNLFLKAVLITALFFIACIFVFEKKTEIF